MNIGILSSRPFPPRQGGLANYVYHTACKFAEKGHKVTLVTRGAGLRVTREVVETSNAYVTVVKVPIIPIYPFHVHIHGFLVRALLSRLRSELDVVHAHSPYVPAIAPPPPLVTTVHTLEKVDSALSEDMGLRSIAYRLSSNIFSSVEKELVRNSTVLTSVSSHVLDELKDVYGLRHQGIVVGNGVDETTFIQNRRSGEGNYVLYVGRIDYRKGLFNLLKCAKYVCNVHPSVSFVLVGEGPLKRALIKEATKIGIGGRIVFLGYVEQDQLVRLYQDAKVFVVPSLYEGLPTVILEAMACGIPVVASRIGGNVDVISHGENGYLVPATLPEEMGRYVLMLLNDERLRKRIGIAARRTIEEKYTWDKVSERLLECLAMAVGE